MIQSSEQARLKPVSISGRTFGHGALLANKRLRAKAEANAKFYADLPAAPPSRQVERQWAGHPCRNRPERVIGTLPKRPRLFKMMRGGSRVAMGPFKVLRLPPISAARGRLHAKARALVSNPEVVVSAAYNMAAHVSGEAPAKAKRAPAAKVAEVPSVVHQDAPAKPKRVRKPKAAV